MTIIFIHGSGGCKEGWHFQTEYFDDSIALDLPGHPDGKLCSTISEYVVWLHHYIQQNVQPNGTEKVVLVGHSMGGAIALQYAIDYPEDLKGIVTIGSGARLRIHPDILNFFENAIDEPAAIKQFNHKTYAHIPKTLAHVLEQRDKQNSPVAFLNDFKACDGFDVMEHLNKIVTPLLAIVGDQDILTPPKYSSFLASHVKRAEEVLIPNGTHFVFAEKYNDVNQHIETFLQTL